MPQELKLSLQNKSGKQILELLLLTVLLTYLLPNTCNICLTDYQHQHHNQICLAKIKTKFSQRKNPKLFEIL